MYLRSKIAIGLAIVGILLLGLGIGQRTIWLPPATVTAAVGTSVKPAPVTVIGPEVLKAKDGQFTMTIKSAGPIQLAVARERDINGWIGDAAHTTISGVNADFTELTAESTAGVEKVPNPAGSDMWVSEEKGTGELQYSWESPGHGDWALLVSADGTAPAPTDITLTADNTAGTPWAVPLMIFGSALLAIAALLLFVTPRKPTASAAGRRSAGRAPSDPAAGTREVERLVAARARARSGATIADMGRSRHGGAAGRPAATPVVDISGASAAGLPRGVFGPPAGLTANQTPAVPASPPSVRADAASTAKPASRSDDDSEPRGGSGGTGTGGTGSGGTGGSGTGTGMGGAPGTGTGGAPAQDGVPAQDGTAEFAAAPPGPVRRGRLAVRSARVRWGAALAAVVVAGSITPAVAADPTTPAPAPAASSPAATGAAPTSAAPQAPGIPVLLDSQVERIAAAVATVVSTGDNAKNAKELQSRVSGLALQVRTANYTIRSKVAKAAAPQPVNSTKLLAKVVTTTATWPRSAVLVTKGENNPLPQLLTLVQSSARENYKLVQATPLLPGQTFPTIDKEGTPEVPLDAANGLKMSPKDAVAALSDRLTKSNSKWKASFKDNVYLTDSQKYQAETLAKSKDATIVFSHKADDKSTIAVRTADGGAMVVVGYAFSVDSTPKKSATINVSDPAAVALAGGKDSTKGVVVTYGEPIVMVIPPASSKDLINIVSASRDLVGAKFK